MVFRLWKGGFDLSNKLSKPQIIINPNKEVKMQTTSLFRVVLISSLIAMAIALVAGLNLAETLPLTLQDYLIQIENEEMSGGEAILGLFAIVILLIALPISTVGLWKFKPWARTLYVVITIAFIPFYPVLGPVVMNAWEAMFSDLSLILEGVLIAMMFIGPVSDKFKSVDKVA